jgi:hypothetical protein
LDNATSEPLIGGTVMVLNTSLGASINFDGEFFIQVTRLPVDLKAKVIGYDSLVVTVTSNKELVVMRLIQYLYLDILLHTHLVLHQQHLLLVYL